MFGRLLKLNFLDTWKEFCSLYGIIIVLGFLLGLSVSMQNQVFLSLMTILFSGSMLAIAVLYLVYVLRISNTSVYGKQGYLTHSIPISSHELILSKILTLFIYIIGFAVSIFIALLLVTAFISPDTASSLLNSVSSEFEMLFHNPLAFFLSSLYDLVEVLAGLVLIQFVFAAANTGITRNKRFLFAIVIYIGIGIILSVLEEIFDPIQILIAIDTDAKLLASNLRNVQPEAVENLSASLFSVWSFILLIVEMFGFYFLTIYILDKKIEIE